MEKITINKLGRYKNRKGNIINIIYKLNREENKERFVGIAVDRYYEYSIEYDKTGTFAMGLPETDLVEYLDE